MHSCSSHVCSTLSQVPQRVYMVPGLASSAVVWLCFGVFFSVGVWLFVALVTMLALALSSMHTCICRFFGGSSQLPSLSGLCQGRGRSDQHYTHGGPHKTPDTRPGTSCVLCECAMMWNASVLRGGTPVLPCAHPRVCLCIFVRARARVCVCLISCM